MRRMVGLSTNTLRECEHPGSAASVTSDGSHALGSAHDRNPLKADMIWLRLHEPRLMLPVLSNRGVRPCLTMKHACWQPRPTHLGTRASWSEPSLHCDQS